MAVLVSVEIERRNARLHLRSLAYYDALTGLPNRVLLKERLDAALAAGSESGHKTAVLFLDLDRFKDVNDTIGHVMGDRLLQVAGERIVGCVRSSETVARMGGDEFIVVMPAINGLAEAVALADRLLRAIDAPFSIAGSEQYTTTSIGIAIAPTDGADSDTLIKYADIAMYRAKDRGRNTYVVFAPELDHSTSTRVANEQGMRRAIERGEFRNYFQPVIDAKECRIHGVEALARWHHPALSVLRPDSFISSAETTGLIVRLGEVVIEDACRQVLGWHRAGLGEIRLAVNLSARQFRQPHLSESLRSILERTGFPARLLELEVSESVAMADADSTIEIMRELVSSGVRMILDDFGTGYSSLAHLRRFPLDGIKIDRSFISGIGRARDDETLVRTMIGMAHSLGLDVIAEGVETAEHVDFLRSEQCDRFQGHIYAPALPAMGCERYLSAWTDVASHGLATGQ
jgi:diguanylate cyclase (GGDEF)-like protein